MNQTELRACMDAYLDTLDNIESREWWCTDRVGYGEVLDSFYNYFAKEARRQEYLKLKAEFEPTPN